MIEQYDISIRPEAEAGLTAMLRSGIYKDQLSVAVRETLANAMDIHQEHGVCTPIRVTVFNDRIEIRDFGPGIGKDMIRGTFFAYGGSTKTHNKKQIGGFGIGAKAPLCYSDIMTVKSFHDGTLSVWAAAVDEAGGRIYNIMEEPTQEHSGLEVSFPFSERDKGTHIDDPCVISHLVSYLLLLNIGQTDPGQTVEIVFGEPIVCDVTKSPTNANTMDMKGTLKLIPNPLQKVVKESPELSYLYHLGIEQGVFVPAWHMDTILSIEDVNGVTWNSWNFMLNVFTCDYTANERNLDLFQRENLFSAAELCFEASNTTQTHQRAQVVSGAYLLDRAVGHIKSMDVLKVSFFRMPCMIIRQPIEAFNFTAGRCSAQIDRNDEYWSLKRYPCIPCEIVYKLNSWKEDGAVSKVVGMTMFLKIVCDLFPYLCTSYDTLRKSSHKSAAVTYGWRKRKRSVVELDTLIIFPDFSNTDSSAVYDLNVYSTAPDRESILEIIPSDTIRGALNAVSRKYGACIRLYGNCAKAQVRHMIHGKKIGCRDLWGGNVWEDVFHESEKLTVQRASSRDTCIGISADVLEKTPTCDKPKQFCLEDILKASTGDKNRFTFHYVRLGRHHAKTPSYYYDSRDVKTSRNDPERGITRALKEHTPYIIQKLAITENTLVFPEYPTDKELKMLNFIIQDANKPTIDGIVFQKENAKPDGHEEFKKFVDKHYGLQKLSGFSRDLTIKNLKYEFDRIDKNFASKDKTLAAIRLDLFYRKLQLIKDCRIFARLGPNESIHIFDNNSVLSVISYHLDPDDFSNLLKWTHSISMGIPKQWRDKIMYTTRWNELQVRPQLFSSYSKPAVIIDVPDFIMEMLEDLSDKVVEIAEKLTQGWLHPDEKLPKMW